jgi:hypothetical protein
MAFQYGVTLRNNQLSQIQTSIGTAGLLKIFTGAEPASCTVADPAGPVATIALPATFLTYTAGTSTLAGTWSVNAAATGTASSFRMYDAAGTCHIQGNTATDLVLNNTSITSGQTVTVTSFSVTAGNF